MRTTPIDRHIVALETTQSLDAIDRPLAESIEREPAPPLPGRYLAVEEDGEQRLLPLSRQITHIGRGFSATLQLEDPGVSRRHAIVVQLRGGARILDDRSANGTWVNGCRVFDAELNPGDVIALGRVVLVYVEVLAEERA